MRLPMAYYGEPVLRQKAASVEKFDDELKAFVEDLIETALAFPNPAGLSAPQVHKSLRIFVLVQVHTTEDGRYEYDDKARPLVFINPVLSDPDPELEAYPQGCFSIPGVYADVVRPRAITVEAYDENGKLFKKRVEGPLAHGVMHENDHLNGVLFIDRVDPKTRKKLDASLRKVKKEYYLKGKK